MNNKEIIDKVAERYGKMWDIKPHVLAGNLWWKDAIEDALEMKDKEIIKIIDENKFKDDYDNNIILVDDLIKQLEEKQ